MEAETLILERDSLRHVSSCHCTVKGSNLVKHSKVGQTVNSGQRLVKGLKMDYRIKNSLLRKLMQILFVNNLLYILNNLFI